MTRGELGMITTPRQGNPIPARAFWCADNGCFGKGFPGEGAWFDWLESFDTLEFCNFAVAPDVVGDAAATLERSTPWMPRMREAGFPVAYALQDGTETVGVPWDDIDAVFIGGSTEWKLGPHAAAAVHEAKARGKWAHMGRVNSERRLRYAAAIGCDSVDGTYLVFGPDKNLPHVKAWLERQQTHPVIAGWIEQEKGL